MADVLADLKNWSATASSNLPSGSTSIGTGLDDNLRQLQATVRQDLASVGANIASAGTCDLGAVAGLFHTITGTTTITSFGTVAAGIWKVLTFSGALTITHNGTSLICPYSANITTTANDTLLAESLGSGNWKIHPFHVATLYAALAGSASQVFSVAAATAVAHAPRADQIQGKSLTAYTTGGTGGAYTLTPTPAITAYAANQEWDVLFHATNTAAPTINISGLGATVNLVRQNYDGTLTNLLAGEIASSTYANVKMVNTTQAVVLTGLERSGTWTPTLTNTTNVAASTAFVCHFSKVGDYVSFFGLVQIDPTTTGATEIGISLPIASNFAATYDAGGTSCSDSFEVGRIYSDITNDRLILKFNATATANASHNFSGGYWIK